MNIINSFRKFRDIYLLNYLLIVIYASVFIYINAEITERLMFSTVDSVTYWLTANEFYKLSVEGYSQIRPFLYPLIILLIYKIAGAYGIWVIQTLFWFIAINLIYLSLKKITANKILCFSGSLLMALNISYLILTMIALTEVTVNLLLSLLIYHISCNLRNLKSLKFFHGCLFILVLLAVIKPVFYLPLLFVLLILMPFFYYRSYKVMPKKIIVLLLVIAPLLFQLTLMKIKYDVFTVSKIGPNTLSWGMLSQGVQQNNGISIEAAREIAENFSSSERNSYLLDNKLLYAKIYLQNLKDNIKAVPCFILYPNTFAIPEAIHFMLITNAVYYYLHIVFIFLVLLCFYIMFKKKERGYLVLLITTALLAYYIFITSPVSFGEGDRLVLTALPLWIVLYCLVIKYLLGNFRWFNMKKENGL